VKRQLRELSRTRLLPADLAAELVIRIRSEAYQAAFSALAADVGRILTQLKAWRAAAPELGRPPGRLADAGQSDT